MIQKIMIEWTQYLSKVCVCVCASIGKEGERAGSRKRERQKEAGSRLQVKHIFAGVCVRAMGRPRARAKIQSKSNKQLDAATLPIYPFVASLTGHGWMRFIGQVYSLHRAE